MRKTPLARIASRLQEKVRDERIRDLLNQRTELETALRDVNAKLAIERTKRERSLKTGWGVSND